MKNFNVFVILLIAVLAFSCSKEEKATCSDGIQNGTETGIDCGGSCDPCPTCSDGIKNGNETGVDCGGDCDPCPTCDDGVQNGNETGIDCGGDCDPCYGVGLPGQAGGIIFYDKGAYTDGWRYLEVASADLNNDGCFSSPQFADITGTDNNIGTGFKNTMNLAEAFPNDENNLYLIAMNHSEGGFSDWFVPSRDELLEIYKNKGSVPNLSNSVGECKAYWNSTLEQLSNGNWLAKVLNITDGSYFFTNPAQRVRLVRRF